MLAGGCAHGVPVASRGVERRQGELHYFGPVYSARTWEATIRFELEGTALAPTEASGPADPAEDARRAVAASWYDPHVLALALTRHPQDPALLAAARAATGSRATDCELAIARTGLLPEPERELVALATRCERALVPAIRMALDRADHAGAIATASRGAASTDPSVERAVLDALVIGADAGALEAFVERHRGEPVFVARVAARAREIDDARLRAALLAPLAALPAFATAAVEALLDAERAGDARALLVRLAPTSIDDRLGLAALALRAGDPEHALAWARSAWVSGASTRALAVQADALDALGRHEEATRTRAPMVPDTAGELARQP